MARPANPSLSLLKYLDALVEKLRGDIPAAVRQHEPNAIHQARVATRRLTAALHVLKPILAKPRRTEFERTLRKFRRRLGPLRDLDVMIGHLTEIRAARMRPTVAWVRQHLGEQRNQQLEKNEKKIDPSKTSAKLGAWVELHQDITTGGGAVDSLIAESLNSQLDAFIAHADGVSKVEPTPQPPTPAPSQTPIQVPVPMPDPHDLRIAGKRLRYSLEMAVANGHKLPRAVSRSFKKMQESLGDWHDFVVLAARLMSLSLEHELAMHDVRSQVEVLNLVKLLLSRATRSLSRFSDTWRKEGVEVTRIIRLTFPLTAPVDDALFNDVLFNAPKTDRDPPGLSESLFDPVPPEVPPGETSTV